MTIVSFLYTSSKTHLTKFVYNFVRRFYLFIFFYCVWRRSVVSDVFVCREAQQPRKKKIVELKQSKDKNLQIFPIKSSTISRLIDKR